MLLGKGTLLTSSRGTYAVNLPFLGGTKICNRKNRARLLNKLE